MSLTIQFGKYKGKQASILLEDENYIRWLKKEGFFKKEQNDKYLQYLKENGNESIQNILNSPESTPSKKGSRFQQYLQTEESLRKIPHYEEIERWLGGKTNSRLLTLTDESMEIMVEGIFLGSSGDGAEEAVAKMWEFLTRYGLLSTVPSLVTSFDLLDL